MRLLNALTIALATSSTVALVLASRATARPLTVISSVQPSMNYAYVRIEGRVPDFPSLNDGSLSFRVLDASGDMRVTAYRAVAESLASTSHLPMPGDLVSIEGTLRIRDDEPSLVLNAPEALVVQPAVATSIRLAALDAMQVGEVVSVTAQVRRVRNVSDNLSILTLRQDSATADMLLPLDVLGAGVPPLQAGDWVTVIGGVGDFRGAKQVLPRAASAISKVAAPNDADAVRPLEALDTTLTGQWLTVQGTVEDLRPMAQGMRVLVNDGTAQPLTVVLFDRVWEAAPYSTTLTVGDVVRVQGELQEYRGELEIVPELAGDLTIDR